MLLKTPGFSAIAILTLALGIGVNLALFTLLDDEFLRPRQEMDHELPFHLETVSGLLFAIRRFLSAESQLRRRGPRVLFLAIPFFEERILTLCDVGFVTGWIDERIRPSRLHQFIFPLQAEIGTVRA
jgi:hypothetical protein